MLLFLNFFEPWFWQLGGVNQQRCALYLDLGKKRVHGDPGRVFVPCMKSAGGQGKAQRRDQWKGHLPRRRGTCPEERAAKDGAWDTW